MAKYINFGGLYQPFSDKVTAKIVILPVPYDKTSTWVKGASNGPQALLEASTHMELYDFETNTEVYKKGIFTDAPVEEDSSPEEMVTAVEKRVATHIKNKKFVVVIGGNHSVSIGAIKAYVDYFQDISVLQLDAHLDLRENYEGSKYNHACVMARVKELCPFVQVGIRSMSRSEKNSMNRKNIFFAQDILHKSEWIEEVISKLKQKVYVTLDLDVFDPSIMPSTGTPEPGGLLWHDVVTLLKNVIAKREVIGFDVVELCPKESNKAPDFLAAKIIYNVLSYKFRNEK